MESNQLGVVKTAKETSELATIQNAIDNLNQLMGESLGRLQSINSEVFGGSSGSTDENITETKPVQAGRIGQIKSGLGSFANRINDLNEAIHRLEHLVE